MGKSSPVIISSIFVLLVMASLLISTLTVANSIMFQQSVHAADNCDATSTCQNTQTGTGNNQENNCTDSSTCKNDATGDRNTQLNRCESSPGVELTFGCFNGAIGNDNAQKITCNEIEDTVLGCFNAVGGNGNTQNLNCANVELLGCSNAVIGNNNFQETNCNSVGEFGCRNQVIGSNNRQVISCTDVGVICNVSADENNNIQNLKCTDVGFACQDSATGDSNTQNLNCFLVGGACADQVVGDGNSQNLVCTRMVNVCGNLLGSSESPTNSNTQSTTCANAGSCLNTGENTNILANGADCESHEPDTTTYCQPNRVIIRPNS